MKNSFFKIALICFFSVCSTFLIAAQNPSCPTQSAGTNFQPKSSVSTNTYPVEDVKLIDPSSETLNTTFTYSTNEAGLKKGEYTVSENNKLQFITKAGEYSILNYNFSDLITTPGQNVYKFQIKVSVSDNVQNCTPEHQHGGAVKLKFMLGGYSTERYETINVGGGFTYEVTHTATAPNVSFSLASNYSTTCRRVTVEFVKMTGCVEKKIVSENGNKVCAGSENMMIAKGMNASSYTWEVSYDNGSSWETIAGATTNSISTIVTRPAKYKVTAPEETPLISDEIRPMVCCATAGDRETVKKIDFTFTGDRKDISLVPGATTRYDYSSGGSINDGQYAIVHKAADGGHWGNRDLNGHTTGGANDGWLLVNCDVSSGEFFELEVTGLCQNTVYDFSAFIANVDTKSDNAPINAGFKVKGSNGTELLNVETGDLPALTNWVEKGASFNSGDNTSVTLTIFNNLSCIDETCPYWQGPPPGQVRGNDIGIDDITFSTCSPEILAFSNSELTQKDSVVCNDGADATINLNVGAVYPITDFFTEPWYVYQEAESGTGPWTNIGDATTSSNLDVTIPGVNGTTKFFRMWVAGDKNTALAVARGETPSGCGSTSAKSDSIKIEYRCACIETPQPTVVNYNECPCTDASGKKPLSSLVTSASTQLRWYTDETGGTPLTDTDFDCQTVNTAGTTYWVTDQSANTATQEYCESAPRVPVKVQVKDGVQYTISPTDITLCLGESVTDADLTYTVSGKNPASAVITWTPDGAAPVTGDTYTLAKQPGSGTIHVSGTDGGACLVETQVTYNLTAAVDFTLSAPSLVCTANPTATLTATIITGSGDWVLTKNGAPFDNGTLAPGETTLEITDPSVSTTPNPAVEYVLTIGPAGCSKTQTVSIEVGDRVDIPIVSSAAANDDTVCADEIFTLTAQITLNPGESLKWIKDGVEIPGETGLILANQTITAQTVYTAELVGGACDGDGTITMKRDELPVPFIESPDSNICLGTLVNIYDTDTTPAESHQWQHKIGTGTFTDIIGKTQKDLLLYEPQETATYKKVVTNGVCTAESNEIEIIVNPPVEFDITPNDTICAGSDIDLTVSNYPPTATIEWYEGTTPIGTDATVTVTPIATTTYTAKVINVCTASKDVTIQVYEAPLPNIESNDTIICYGAKIDIIDTDTSVAESYQWEQKVGTAFVEMPGKTQKDLLQFKPEQSATYRKIATNDICSTISNEIYVFVAPEVTFNINADEKICEGESVELKVSQYPTTGIVEWYQGTTLITTEPITLVTPEATTTYTAKVTDICSASKDVTITVEPNIIPHISDSAFICFGDRTTLTASGGTFYEWTPTTGLNNPNASTTEAKPEVTTTYVVKISTDVCSAKDTVTVSVNELPEITDVIETDVRQVEVIVIRGTTPYGYSLTGDEDDYTSSNIMSDVRIGKHIMYVIDDNGCKDEKEFEVSPVPVTPDIFFSPNDDGINDVWTVENLHVYDSYVIEIFDRFGRRVYVKRTGTYNSESGGESDSEPFTWDGMYDGHQLPSTDYWYIITIEEIRKQYTGHFTLKR